MKKEEKKVNFDMSVLTLDELIKVYDEITNFLLFLEDKKIQPEQVEKDNE